MKKNALVFTLLVIIPAIMVWWFYVPLAFFVIFYFKKIYITIFAGFVLDTLYFPEQFPMLFSISFIVSLLFITLENKLRYNV